MSRRVDSGGSPSSKGSSHTVVPSGSPPSEQRVNVPPPSSNYNFVKAFKGFKVDQDAQGYMTAQPVWIIDPATGNPIQIAKIGTGASFVLALETSSVDFDVQMAATVALQLLSPLQHAAIGHTVHSISAANTAQVFILDSRDLRKTLAINSVGSAGTHTLVVEVSVDGTNFITIDSIAAAANQVKQYTETTVGATIALSPLSFRFIRITLGAAGVGNTTTVDISMK